jgi:hypothetical protein
MQKKAKVRRHKKNRSSRNWNTETNVSWNMLVTLRSQGFERSDFFLVPKFDTDSRERNVYHRKIRVDAAILAHNRFVDQLEGRPHISWI